MSKSFERGGPIRRTAAWYYHDDPRTTLAATLWEAARTADSGTHGKPGAILEAVTGVHRDPRVVSSVAHTLVILREDPVPGRVEPRAVSRVRLCDWCTRAGSMGLREISRALAYIEGLPPGAIHEGHERETASALRDALVRHESRISLVEDCGAGTYQSHTWEPETGDVVRNTNTGCKHFGSAGVVTGVGSLDGDMGKTVTYRCTNSGPTWSTGDTLTKTMDQVSPTGDQVSRGAAWHLDHGVGLDRPVSRPGTPEFFDDARHLRRLHGDGQYAPTSGWEEEMLTSDLGDWAEFDGELVPLDFPILEKEGEWDEPCSVCAAAEESEVNLGEAEYKGREVELNKPKRGSGGKAYVYVRNPDSGNVIKVEFGSSMPDAMGDSDAARKRRKSFGDRHNCSDKKDKTKPGYWSCRATKFFGRNIPGWW